MSEVSSLRQMANRRDAWLNEKPSWDGTNLRLSRDDLVIGQFVANGDDGDKFIKIYRAHMLSVVSKSGGQNSIPRYCPIKSGDESVSECPYCQQGHSDIKERMSMWFDVSHILHAQMPSEKSYPQVNYEGRIYFDEQLGTKEVPSDFRLWNTSAWRESPWSDILKLADLYNGLHNFTFQLAVLGDNLARRYKIYAVPNSPKLPTERYQLAHTACKEIPEILRAEMATPVVNQSQTAQPQNINRGNTVPFQLPGMGASIPNLQFNNQPSPDDLPFDLPAEDEDNRRPMKSLF